MNIQPLILSGGSGTRLWPQSCENGFHDNDFYLHLAAEVKRDLIVRAMGMSKHERVAYAMRSAADAHSLIVCIGGGLLISHPNGVVTHPEARIGPNYLIFQQVTIGARKDGVPYVGGHVNIGAGAKILGNVQIGDHACIGANAVVLLDVPEGKMVIGVPAVIVGG